MIAPDVLDSLRPPLLSYALKHLHIKVYDDREEVVQETLARVWSAQPESDQREEVLAYATTVMKRIHIDTHRQRQRQPTISLDTEEGRYAAAVAGRGTVLGITARPSRLLAVLDIQKCQVCGSYESRCACCG